MIRSAPDDPKVAHAAMEDAQDRGLGWIVAALCWLLIVLMTDAALEESQREAAESIATGGATMRVIPLIGDRP